jgi:16S rRNA G1207 methylase RsmC
VTGWKMIVQANRNLKQAGVAVFIANKIDSKTKKRQRLLYNDQGISSTGRYNICKSIYI